MIIISTLPGPDPGPHAMTSLFGWLLVCLIELNKGTRICFIKMCPAQLSWPDLNQIYSHLQL